MRFEARRVLLDKVFFFWIFQADPGTYLEALEMVGLGFARIEEIVNFNNKPWEVSDETLVDESESAGLVIGGDCPQHSKRQCHCQAVFLCWLNKRLQDIEHAWALEWGEEVRSELFQCYQAVGVAVVYYQRLLGVWHSIHRFGEVQKREEKVPLGNGVRLVASVSLSLTESVESASAGFPPVESLQE